MAELRTNEILSSSLFKNIYKLSFENNVGETEIITESSETSENYTFYVSVDFNSAEDDDYIEGRVEIPLPLIGVDWNTVSFSDGTAVCLNPNKEQTEWDISFSYNRVDGILTAFLTNYTLSSTIYDLRISTTIKYKKIKDITYKMSGNFTPVGTNNNTIIQASAVIQPDDKHKFELQGTSFKAGEVTLFDTTNLFKATITVDFEKGTWNFESKNPTTNQEAKVTIDSFIKGPTSIYLLISKNASQIATTDPSTTETFVSPPLNYEGTSMAVTWTAGQHSVISVPSGSNQLYCKFENSFTYQGVFDRKVSLVLANGKIKDNGVEDNLTLNDFFWAEELEDEDSFLLYPLSPNTMPDHKEVYLYIPVSSTEVSFTNKPLITFNSIMTRMDQLIHMGETGIVDGGSSGEEEEPSPVGTSSTTFAINNKEEDTDLYKIKITEDKKEYIHEITELHGALEYDYLVTQTSIDNPRKFIPINEVDVEGQYRTDTGSGNGFPVNVTKSNTCLAEMGPFNLIPLEKEEFLPMGKNHVYLTKPTGWGVSSISSPISIKFTTQSPEHEIQFKKKIQSVRFSSIQSKSGLEEVELDLENTTKTVTLQTQVLIAGIVQSVTFTFNEINNIITITPVNYVLPTDLTATVIYETE